jgi:hypothetical protein
MGWGAIPFHHLQYQEQIYLPERIMVEQFIALQMMV